MFVYGFRSFCLFTGFDLSVCHFLLLAQKKVTKEKSTLPQLLRMRKEAGAQAKSHYS
jgi:hypothetical protein